MPLAHRLAWIIVLVVTMVMTLVVVPQLAANGPQELAIDTPTEIPLQVASITVPYGWQVDIPSTAGAVLAARRDGVEVVAFDVLWLGSSEALVSRAAELLSDGGAQLPVFDEDAHSSCLSGTGTREELRITVPDAGEGEPRRIDVVRQDCTALVLHVTGPAAAVEALTGDIDAMVDSAWLPDAGLGALDEGRS